MSNLTKAELRAIAYYAVGVASEGRDVAYELRFCGYASKGPNGEAQLKPIGNSGYTIGEMQTDLGARESVAHSLVSSFQTWARSERPDWVMPAALAAQAATDLGRDGRRIRDPDYAANNAAYKKSHRGQELPSRLLPSAGLDIDEVLKERLNKFLATDAGKSFVHTQDAAQVEVLMDKVAARLEEVPLYKKSSPEDQAKLFGVVAKAYNQGPAYAKRILDDLEAGRINSLADVDKRINTFPDYMRTGSKHALDGVDVFNALRNSSVSNSMHGPWQTVIASPLVDPTQVRNDPTQPHLGKQYDTVKGLFVQPKEGVAFVLALEQGGIQKVGKPATAHSRGFHVAGKDFVQWDRSGEGRAFIGGQWSEFSRSDLTRVDHKDKSSYELRVTRDGETQPLFHGGKGALHITDPHKAAPTETPHVRLDDPLHPGHAMYQQAHEGMRRIDARMGRTPDRFTDNAAACLAVAACRAGLTRIDDVAMGENGKSVWVLQGRPGSVYSRTASEPVKSFSTPLEQTSEQWALAQQQVEHRREMTLQRLEEFRQSPPQADPAQAALAMRM